MLTNRHPLTEFKVRAAFDPFVSEVITPSKESSYLFGESAQYPTVMLDLDGNERASIGLRNNTFNKLHVLLDQLTRRKLPGPLRTAALNAFIALRAQAAPDWTRDLDRLEEDVLSLEAQIGRQRALVETQPKEWAPAQRDLGLDKDARRQASRIETWKAEHRAYSEYAVTMRRLLALQPSDFDPGRFKIESVIPAKSLGPLNTLADLQNYVVGPAAGGLVLAPGGALDLDRSFRTIDYFAAFDHLAVRNNVQAEVSPRPVDFTAMRIHWQDADHNQDGVWLRRSPLLQALILTRQLGAGPLELRYLPVANLTPAPGGSLHFDHADWAPGFPLELFEDPQLAIPPPQRAAWLSEWHSEREWLEAAHRTRYSNGIVGLVEQVLDLNPAAAQDSRYLNRKRQLRRADLLVFANDHWNFNVRGFNPGGNHGSLLRPSTHSVLMLAGGASTAIPRGAHIAAPYDSLSFLPTVLTLMHRAEPDLPGTPISELVAPTQ